MIAGKLNFLAATKLDFSMTVNGHLEAVKVHIFEDEVTGKSVRLDGGDFNGCEISLNQLDDMIRILEEVRDVAKQGVWLMS